MKGWNEQVKNEERIGQDGKNEKVKEGGNKEIEALLKEGRKPK
jgi:hypothetical protein